MVAVVLYSGKLVFDIKQNIEEASIDFSKEIAELDENDSKAERQNQRYLELMKMETNLNNCKSPYIPEGFGYVEGQWDTGFVIEDEKQNQFVWVPCTNIENQEDIPILQKRIFDDNNKTYFYCYEQEDYEEFIQSSLANGGFYISRFEIGKEGENPVSKVRS
ncbi:MAG: hypothetical protein IJ867_08090 [Clostridia bacterium]|nr:hypothetical protein [Clostridia bacterium]